MKRNSHVTLADIAARLSVSTVTVSKALRGHPDVSDATTKEVRKMAAELGYSPNRMARNLSARKSHLIGLVVPKIAHFFFGSVIEAVYNKALEYRYETILMVSHENAAREIQHLQTLVSMRVDGILISVSAQTRDNAVFEWIKTMGIPLLFVDRVPDPALKDCPSVTTDDYGGAVLAIEQALAAGHRTIACVGGVSNINIGRNRIKGYTDTLQRHGIEVRSDWIVSGGYNTDAGYEGFMRLCSQPGGMPRCIFAVTYPVALGIYQAAKEKGVSIPRDVDVICFGDSDVGKLLTPALSCIGQPTLELGERAVDNVMAMINDPDSAKPGNLVIPTKLILRETCVASAESGPVLPGLTIAPPVS